MFTQKKNDDKRSKCNAGFCYIEVCIASMVLMIVWATVLQVAQISLQEVYALRHGLEITQMDRFARQIVVKELKEANEEVVIFNDNSSIRGVEPKNWGFEVNRKGVYKYLSDMQRQPLTGQIYRKGNFAYQHRILNDVFRKDNNLIQINWESCSREEIANNKVKIAAYPYYYYLN